jgi:hypothetical protein
MSMICTMLVLCFDESFNLAVVAWQAKSPQNGQPKRPTSPLPPISLKAQHRTDSVRDYLGVAHGVLGDDAGTPTAMGPLQSSATPPQQGTPHYIPNADAAKREDEQPPIALFGAVPVQPTVGTPLGFGASLWRPQSSTLSQAPPTVRPTECFGCF